MMSHDERETGQVYKIARETSIRSFLNQHKSDR
jgi:hypothetical protein